MHCNHDIQHILNRVEMLRKENQEGFSDRWRTQMIMDGGVNGIYAVMAWDLGKGSSSRGRKIAQSIGVDLPTVNLMASGLERTAQKIGREPTLKAPLADEDDVRKKLQRRIDLLKQWETDADQELVFPQLGRWLPGYGFGMFSIKQRRNPDKEFYPVAELRDSFDLYPGFYGANQQPQDLYSSRKIPLYALKRAYPELFEDGTLEERLKNKRLGRGIIMHTARVQTGPRTSGWEGDLTGLEVCEYMADCGTHVVIPELEIQLTGISNPLDSGPMFVFMKRFAFNKLINQYHHIVGLQAMMAKLNVLSLIAAEDGTFRETNIFGELESGTYQRGRKAVNVFERGARVEKPVSDNLVQTWNQLDRLERYMRVGANYDVQQDGTSPNSFATGRGMIELQGSMGANVREYHLVIANGTRRADSKKLELAEILYKSSKRKFYDMYGARQNLQVNTVINGDYRTRRIFGAMATFDDNEKVIIGLQLMQGGVIDVETMQENMDGLTDLVLINERNAAKAARDVLYQRLAARSEQDPKADAALVEIMQNPGDREKILLKYFTPQEPDLSPEEQAALQQMQQMGAGGGGASPGAPESIGTVLSRIETGQMPEAGVQTTGRLA